MYVWIGWNIESTSCDSPKHKRTSMVANLAAVLIYAVPSLSIVFLSIGLAMWRFFNQIRQRLLFKLH